MVAARYRLQNLHVIVDANGEQECGWNHDKTLSQEPVPNDVAKWKAFGWAVKEVNGNDIYELRAVFASLPFEKGKPSVFNRQEFYAWVFVGQAISASF